MFLRFSIVALILLAVVAFLADALVGAIVFGPVCPPYSADPYAILCTPG